MVGTVRVTSVRAEARTAGRMMVVQAACIARDSGCVRVRRRARAVQQRKAKTRNFEILRRAEKAALPLLMCGPVWAARAKHGGLHASHSAAAQRGGHALQRQERCPGHGLLRGPPAHNPAPSESRVEGRVSFKRF